MLVPARDQLETRQNLPVGKVAEQQLFCEPLLLIPTLAAGGQEGDEEEESE